MEVTYWSDNELVTPSTKSDLLENITKRVDETNVQRNFKPYDGIDTSTSLFWSRFVKGMLV